MTRERSGAAGSQRLLPEEGEIVTSLLSGKSSVRYILNTARKVLGNPLAVVDRSLRLLEHSAEDGIEDHVWDRLLSDRRVPLLDEGFFRQYEEFSATRRPLLLTMASPHRWIVSDVSSGSDVYGAVSMLEYHRPFRDEDYRIMQTLGKTLGVQMRQSALAANYQRGGYEHLLASLVNGYDMGEREMEALIELFGMRAIGRMRLLVMVPNVNIDRFVVMPHIRHDFESRFPVRFPLLLGSELLCLVELDGREGAEGLKGRIAGYCSDNGLNGCLSREFDDIRLVSRHYRMVSEVMRVKERLTEDSSLFDYDDYLHYHLIGIAAKTSDVESLAFPGIKLLAESRGNADGVLLRTLEAYFAHSCDIAKTAKAMCVHYNTIAYRLDRISGICGLDARDSRNHALLQTSLFIHRFCAAGKPVSPP